MSNVARHHESPRSTSCTSDCIAANRSTVFPCVLAVQGAAPLYGGSSYLVRPRGVTGNTRFGSFSNLSLAIALKGAGLKLAGCFPPGGLCRHLGRRRAHKQVVGAWARNWWRSRVGAALFFGLLCMASSGLQLWELPVSVTPDPSTRTSRRFKLQ